MSATKEQLEMFNELSNNIFEKIKELYKGKYLKITMKNKGKYLKVVEVQLNKVLTQCIELKYEDIIGK